jgi:hypothetical protein
MKARSLLCLAACTLCMACSDGGDDGTGMPDGGFAGGTSGAGHAGSGGVMSAGTGGFAGMSGGDSADAGGNGGVSSGGAGDAGAGSSGSGGGSGPSGPPQFDPADHCAPGQYYAVGRIEADRAFGGLAINCYGEEREQAIANGIGDRGEGWINLLSIRLPEPMDVGKAAAMSTEMMSLSGGPSRTQLEYWAASTECGSTGPLEKFFERGVDSTGVYCGGLTPTIAYSYIIEVTRPRPDVSGSGSSRRGVTLCISGTCPNQ